MKTNIANRRAGGGVVYKGMLHLIVVIAISLQRTPFCKGAAVLSKLIRSGSFYSGTVCAKGTSLSTVTVCSS